MLVTITLPFFINKNRVFVSQSCYGVKERNGEPDFSKKHDLEHKWTLWFDNPKGSQKPSTWGQTLRAVYTFGTVEDFWW